MCCVCLVRSVILKPTSPPLPSKASTLNAGKKIDYVHGLPYKQTWGSTFFIRNKRSWLVYPRSQRLSTRAGLEIGAVLSSLAFSPQPHFLPPYQNLN